MMVSEPFGCGTSSGAAENAPCGLLWQFQIAEKRMAGRLAR